jgi:hypothetical protein
VGFELERDLVIRLRERSRQEGASQHSALCAAQTLAIHETLSPDQPCALSVYSPTDLRGRMEYNGELGVPSEHTGQFVGYASSLLRVSPGADLWSTARLLHQQLQARLKTLDDMGYNALNHGLMRLLRWWFSSDLKGADRLARTAERASKDTSTLTDLGEMAPEGESAHLGESASVSAATIPGTPFMSSAIRWRGKLTWTFSWTEPMVDEELARRIAFRSTELLLSAFLDQGDKPGLDLPSGFRRWG